MEQTNIVTAATTPAARVTLHGKGTELSDIPGFRVLRVKEQAATNRPYAIFRAPAIDPAELLARVQESETLQAALMRVLLQAQREIVQDHLANGANPASGASIEAEALTLAAVEKYLATDGATTIRLTKELLKLMAPAFAVLCANRFAQVRGELAATMTEEELFAASRPAYERAWQVAQAATVTDATIDEAAGAPVLRVLDGVADLAATGFAQYVPAFRALRAKLVKAMELSAEINRVDLSAAF